MSKLFQLLRVAPEDGRLLGAIYFAFFTSGHMSVMLGSLLPYIRDENAFSYSQGGLMLSAHQLGNLCAVFVAGVLPFIIGRRKSTLIMGIGMALGLPLAVLTNNLWLLLTAFAITGVGRGTMSNISGAVTAEVAGNKPAAINFLHAFFAVGALLSPLTTVLFVQSLGSGWKPAALAASALCLAGWANLARAGLPDAPPKKEEGGSFLFMKDKQFWISTMILFFYLCAEASIIGWFVSYFQDTGLLPESVAKFTPTMLWVMILIGRVSCAAISSRVQKERLLLALAVCFTLCFTGMLLSRSAAVCVFFLLGSGLSMAGIYPTAFATIRNANSTAATGITIGTATLGAIIMPGIVGAVADSYGIIGGVASVLAALLCMVVLTIVKLVTADK